MEGQLESAGKLESPLGAPRITEQPRRHGSSARYVHDNITHKYRHGGVVGHVAWFQGSSLGAQDRSWLFLVIPFGRTAITLYTHTSCVPWPSGHLSAGIIHHRCVCMCIALGKQRKFAWRRVGISLVAIFVFRRSEPSLRYAAPTAVGTRADALRS